ncbi:MAG: outer membrane beta-barrel protein [Candidatus Kapaibacterium sp.]
MKKNSFIVSFALCMVLAAPLEAQILSRGDLFGPGAPPPMIGVELGLGQHTQNGTFQAICQCQFSNASGNGFLAGLLFELPVSYEWTIGLGVKFDFKGYTATTNVLETATVTFSSPTNPNDSVSTGGLGIERDAKIRETFLVLAPFLRYEFARNGPFVQAGPGISFLLSSNFTHTRILSSSTITLSDGTTISNVRFDNGTRQEEIENGKIPNVASLRLSALATVGWNILVSDNAVLAPMVTFDIPFTTVRPNTAPGPSGADNWKITSLYFSAGLKYKLD